MVVAASMAMGPAAPAARADEVTVFAASSLADVVTEIGRGFESSTRHRVVFNFGGSNDLARQIARGAPADIFFSADRAQVESLFQAGQVRAAEAVDALSNTLAVIVPAGSARTLRTAADLLPLERLALADPEAVPAGVYARQWLTGLGLWERLRDRVVPTLNVRAAVAAVESASVDAGIVYRTDARLSSRVRVAFEVPHEAGPPIVYVVAPVGAPGAAARGLLAELLSAHAAAAYQRHGFVVLYKR